MENTPQIELSDYQHAILNEMGISIWKLVNKESIQAKVENPILEVVTVTSEVTSKENALANLKQLKTQTTQTTEITDSVIVTFLQNDTKLQIFTDVLLSLGLEAKQQKYIPVEQLSQYSGYSLSWTQGEKVSLKNKQLTTPTLAQLQHSDSKKQLWQQLQNALSHTKT